jgi:hypothetical protein
MEGPALACKMSMVLSTVELTKMGRKSTSSVATT